jgi:nucleoside-diphosphate-sugar epimerase
MTVKLLILGGTGFIGPHVVRQLDAAGHDVTIAHSGAHEADLPASVRHLHTAGLSRGAGRDLAEVAEHAAAWRPDAVLDMAPLGEDDARRAVEAFRGRAGRLVAVSSGDVYRAYDRFRGKDPGPPDPTPLTEDSPLRDRLYPYRGEKLPGGDRPWVDDYDKILVEQVVMGEPSLPGTILRLPMVYGPNDAQHRFFNQCHLKRMLDRRPAILLDESLARWRCLWGYIENVAHAIALALTDDRAAGRIYNVAEAEPAPEAEWIARVGRAADWHGQIIPLPKERLPEHLHWGGNAEQDWAMSSERIRRELGYREIVPQDEAMRRTIAWERANPPEAIDPGRYDYAAEDRVLASGARSAQEPRSA